MELSRDLNELLVLFVSRNVKFVVVGAHALAFHGVPRYTGDLDLLVEPDPGNAERILNALDSFGFGGLGITREDFIEPDRVVQLGNSPSRVDILTSITGVSWKEAEENADEGSIGDTVVRFLGRRELIRNKRATGRTQDLADLERLAE